MKVEYALELLPIITAYAHGHPIEYRRKAYDGMSDIDHPWTRTNAESDCVFGSMYRHRIPLPETS